MHFANLTENENLSGKIVYNELAKILMQSAAMLKYSLRPTELLLKDIRIAKLLVLRALP